MARRSRLATSSAFDGAPDPRDAGPLIPEEPPHVLTAMGFSDGGRVRLRRLEPTGHPAWESGAGRRPPARRDREQPGAAGSTTGEGDARRVYDAPRVVGSARRRPRPRRARWYEWWPRSPTARVPFDSDVPRPIHRGIAGGAHGSRAWPAAATTFGTRRPTARWRRVGRVLGRRRRRDVRRRVAPTARA